MAGEGGSLLLGEGGKCERLALQIVTQDLSNPTHVIEVLRRPLYKQTGWPRSGPKTQNAMKRALHWQGRIRALIERAAAARAAQASAGPARGEPATTSVSVELERLKKLHEQGALTEREFSEAKARVLRG
jgi:hypothetical protein